MNAEVDEADDPESSSEREEVDESFADSDSGRAVSQVAEGASAAWPRYRLALLIAIVIVVADQLTKEWALAGLNEPGETFDLFWKLRFRLIYNTGAAFSSGSGAGPLIGVLVILVAAGLLFMIRRVKSRGIVALLGLVLGGAIGNLLDRLFRGNPIGEDGFLRGAVVDFVDVQFWPVFNVADMAVVVGALALVVFGWREDVEP